VEEAVIQEVFRQTAGDRAWENVRTADLSD
jgi:hypothetical protein